MQHREQQGGAAPATVDADEAALVRRVAGKDGAAFELLYRGYYRRLTRFVEQLTRKRHLIDEILDDTMLVVWRKAGSFTGVSRVSTWIFAIAYHEVMRAHQRERRAVRSLPDFTTSAAVPSVESDLIAAESKSWLRHVVAELSVEQRAVIELTYFHGFGYKEIAEVIGCPVNTVKTRMFHARRRLKALLVASGAE